MTITAACNAAGSENLTEQENDDGFYSHTRSLRLRISNAAGAGILEVEKI
jgi:hypothetical protein